MQKDKPDEKKVWGKQRSYEVKPESPNKKRDMLQAKNLKKVDADTASPTDTGDSAKIKEGMEVFHERFGRGKVVVIEGTGQNRKATVNFKTAGEKQLLLRFAKLKVL
jgi:DNA helicase-2/ATP-dependent DNA helicase PcrA